MAPRPYFKPNGEVLSFAVLMELERLDDQTYRSVTRAYSPTGGQNGTYGGHVYAQAVWAAAQTVKEGFLIHNVTGWFLLGGLSTEHFTYTVINIRDGGNYATRTVTAVQRPERGPTFTCTCSFKRAEPSPVEYQERTDLKRKFDVVIGGKGPFDHPDAPSQDSRWFHEDYLPKHPEHLNPLPGLHLRKVDMAAYNKSRAPIDKRQLTYYSLRGSLPLAFTENQPSGGSTISSKNKPGSISRQANLHAIAHLYASDRNSLFIAPNHLDLPRDYTRMASLSHTVIFHVGIEDLLLSDEPPEDDPRAFPTAKESGRGEKGGERKWYVQESWVGRVAGGRAQHMSRIWDPERGLHVASTMQDGLVRFKPTAKLKL